jgi:hypothetical protein
MATSRFTVLVRYSSLSHGVIALHGTHPVLIGELTCDLRAGRNPDPAGADAAAAAAPNGAHRNSRQAFRESRPAVGRFDGEKLDVGSGGAANGA